jgi:hypothetical protein
MKRRYRLLAALSVLVLPADRHDFDRRRQRGRL